jgi:hypothetical protein
MKHDGQPKFPLHSLPVEDCDPALLPWGELGENLPLGKEWRHAAAAIQLSCAAPRKLQDASVVSQKENQ